MQIDFATSGGVTNQELTYQADTNTLREEAAKELTRLVESCGLFELQQKDLNPNVTVGRADVISYRLSLSDGNRQTTLWMNDVTACTRLRTPAAGISARACTGPETGRVIARYVRDVFLKQKMFQFSNKIFIFHLFSFNTSRVSIFG
jgi:hypothetical protein